MLEIVKKAQKGDEIAFQLLYERYYKQAYYYAFKICHYNEADAFDATQEAFVAIHTHLPRLQNPEYFVAWMSKIVLSKCTKLFRTRKDVYLDDKSLLQMNAQETKRDYLPTAMMHEQTDIEIVQKMISELSPILAESLCLIYFEQLSYKEVANRLHVPEGTVKSRVNQGREHLKQKVKAFEAKEGRKIDFKLEGFLPTSFVFSLLSKLKYGVSTSLIQGTILVVTVSTLTIGGYSLYQAIQGDSTTEVSSSKLVQNEFPSSHFSSVVFEGEEIKTAKSAYFTLMNWAANDKEFQKHKNENLTDVSQVVKAISESDSVYKNMLEKQGWFEAFENIL